MITVITSEEAEGIMMIVTETRKCLANHDYEGARSFTQLLENGTFRNLLFKEVIEAETSESIKS